jgi:hypothetical protein
MSIDTQRVYAQCGLRIRSEFDLHLPVAPGDAWDVDVRWGPDIFDSHEPPPGSEVAHYSMRSQRWYSATEIESGYLLRFHRCGEFFISADLSTVEVRCDRSGRHELLPVLTSGTMLAFLLSLRGATVLHASAVALGDAALAFVGQSGHGKSTLAALMCLDGGADLVTDDVLVVRAGAAVTCIGGASELRLRSAAAPIAEDRSNIATRATVDERVAVSPPSTVSGPLPLAAIVIPWPTRESTEIEIHRASASDALAALLAFPRVHGWQLADVITRDFLTLVKVVEALPVYVISIPWGPPFDARIARSLAALVSAGNAVG